MVLTGVIVAIAILITLALKARSKERARIATAFSVVALLAAAGCSSNSDTTASDVSSNLSSAAETLASSAESVGSDLSSAAASAGTEVQSAADTAMSNGESVASGAESSMTAATSPASGTYPPEQAQLCQARDELRTSLGELTNPALLTQGASAIGAEVDKVQNNIDAVVTSAQPELKPQLDALQASVEKLRTAVGNLGDGNVAANVQAVGAAAGEVGSASTAVLSELDNICGS